MNCDHCGDVGEPRQVKIAENAQPEYKILCGLCCRLWKHANNSVPVRVLYE